MAHDWSKVPLAASYFEPKAIVALNAETAVVGGSHAPGMGYALEAHEGAIYRWSQSSGAERVYSGTGQVLALANSGTEIWAVISAKWKDYRVLHSTDAGESWAAAGAIPAKTFAGLVASENALWAYGIDTLFVSNDHGRSWKQAKTPRPPALRSRFAWSHLGLTQYGDTLLISDGKGSWDERLSSTPVVAMAESWIVAQRDSGYALGRWDNGQVTWQAKVSTQGTPVYVQVDDATIRILAVPKSGSVDDVMRGWVYLHSDDGGTHWRTGRLEAPMDEVYPPAALISQGGFALARDGGLYVYRPK